MEYLRSPYEVTCPHCGAPALCPCRMPRGTPVLPHRERIRKISRHHPSVEKEMMSGSLRALLWEQMQNLARQDSFVAPAKPQKVATPQRVRFPLRRQPPWRKPKKSSANVKT